MNRRSMPRENIRRPHPLDMAVHAPEPEPEAWYERHAGKLTLLLLLMSASCVGGFLYLVHLVLCVYGL